MLFTKAIVGPGQLGPVLSTQVVLYVLFGGVGTLIGGIIGVAMIELFSYYLSQIWDTGWPIVLGLLLLVVVMFKPSGLIGFLVSPRERVGFVRRALARARRRPQNVARGRGNPMSPSSGTGSMLAVRGLRKSYATLTALDGVDLNVSAQSFHGLIGPNGSGKSTLLKSIAGAETPTAGSVTFLGHDITRATPTERARAGMSLKFQITSVLPALRVYDNVLLAVQAQDSMAALFLSRTRGSLHRRVMDMLHQFRLEERADELAGTLSHGQQQWLEIAMALAREPKLLLLDEPTAGMSAPERRATGDLLAPIRERCSMLIVEHDLDFIRDLCDTLTVLDQGSIVASGPTQIVQNSDKVREAYLSHA